MSLDKFGRSLHNHLRKIQEKKIPTYGLLNITLKSTNHHIQAKKIVYDLSTNYSIYEFPLKEGIINHVAVNEGSLQININNKLYKHGELLNIKLQFGDKIILESPKLLAHVFLEMIIKYPILTE